MAQSNHDIRWKQRFSNYKKALELAWNVMKDYYEFQGATNIQGSRDAIRMAFNRGLIKDGEDWMKMIESRINTSHTYNEATAREISNLTTNIYYPLFIEFEATMENIQSA